jgi:hypothetical protein
MTASPTSPFALPAAGLTVTLTADPSTANGNSTLSFQAVSGSLSASTSANLTVGAPASFGLNPIGNEVTVRMGGNSNPLTIGQSIGVGAENYTLQLSAVGLPPGVTAVFTPNPAPPDTQLSVTFSAAALTTATTDQPIYFQAVRSTDNFLVDSRTIALNVAPAVGQSPANRTQFVREDDTPSAAVYDAVHNLVFASLPTLSRVDVISPVTGEIVKSIPVPGGYGLSPTPDGTRILVTSWTQQLVWIDTTTLTIVQRPILPIAPPNCTPCDPQFFSPVKAAVTSTGKVLLVGTTPFFFGIMEWDPVANTLTYAKNSFISTTGLMAPSADGTKVFFSDDSTAGGVAVYDAVSDSITAARDFGNFGFAIAANPNGTQFVVAVDTQPTYVLDKNLNIVGTAPIDGLITGLAYSPDGRFLYAVSEPAGVPIISTIDAHSLRLIATAPAYASSEGDRVPSLKIEAPFASDNTGLIFGAADHGLAVDDATFYKNFSSGLLQSPMYMLFVNPGEGALNASASVMARTDTFSDAPDVWFGGQRAVTSSLNNIGQVLATAPPSATAGPVNVRFFDTDGTTATIPQGFTYGVSPINFYGALAAGPGGGATADIWGYGLGIDLSGNPTHVQIGGQAAPNTATTPYQLTLYPFPLDHLQVVVPPVAGASGAKDVVITNPAGTGTMKNGFHYLASLQDYASPDSASFKDVVYDQLRQQLYLSAGDHVDVFSLNVRSYLPPITPPSIGTSRQLMGMAMTIDGSKLLVSDYGDNSIAVLNPDDLSTAKVVQVVPPGNSGTPGPYEVAPTSLNTAFIITTGGFIRSGNGVFVLDLNTMTVSQNTGTLQPGIVLVLGGVQLSSSKDGATAFLVQGGSSGGPIVTWTAATNTWIGQDTNYYLYDGAVSGDGNIASEVGAGVPSNITVHFSDPHSNWMGSAGVPDFLAQPYGQVPGERLNDSGSLAYVPSVEGIDIYDVQHGDRRERILLTEQMTPSTNMPHEMAIDETGSRIFLITNAGLTIAQLDSVPLSIGSVIPASGTGGTPIKIRGSGFLQGATVSCNGVNAPATVIDANTIQFSLPSSIPSGAVQITVSNPASDGQTYSLDDAFATQ